MTERNTSSETKRPRRPSLLLRVFPSLTDVAFLMPLVFVFGKLRGAKTLLGDGDTGWHIRTGEWILANGRVPREDIFSYTRPGEEWFAWEWMWDAAFAWLHAVGGMEAVVLVSQLVICLTCALLYRLARQVSGNVLLSIAVTFVAAAAMSIHWLARPHLFSLLFTVVMYGLLERTRADERFRRLLWAPLLTALWVNIHGGFFVGVILIACYAGGELASAWLDTSKDGATAALRRARQYAFAAVGCATASLLNPYGWRLHEHIYAYLTESYHFRFINEFQSLSFQSPAAIYFEALLVLASGAVFLNLSRRRFAHVFLLAGWAHLALLSARNIPIFAIVAAPLAAEALREGGRRLRQAQLADWIRSAVEGFEEFAADVGRTDAPARMHVVSAGTFLMLTLLVYGPAAKSSLRAEYDPKIYPVAAVAALDEFSPVRIFASDEWGDYLIYRRHESLRVFVDGRSDFYGPEFGERYMDAMSVRSGWQSYLEEYEVDTVLLSVKAALAGAMKEASAWRVVYDDGVAVIFQRRDRERIAAGHGDGGLARLSGSSYNEPRSEWRRELQPAE